MVLDLIRYGVFIVFVASSAVVLGSWALRTRRLNPFSRTGRLVRRASDAVLDPIETWQLKRGGNPQNAGWWLIGGTLVGGIVLITGAEWLTTTLRSFARATSAGPRSTIRLVVRLAGNLVLLALIIRVIGSWFGLDRFNRWVGWTYRLTDWIVRPLQRLIPPLRFGLTAVDITPIVAWFLLAFLIDFIGSLL